MHLNSNNCLYRLPFDARYYHFFLLVTVTENWKYDVRTFAMRMSFTPKLAKKPIHMKPFILSWTFCYTVKMWLEIIKHFFCTAFTLMLFIFRDLTHNIQNYSVEVLSLFKSWCKRSWIYNHSFRSVPKCIYRWWICIK